MKRINYLYFLFAFFVSCSGINKMTKMAFTFEQEGMYKQASEYYINALNIKRNHIDASLGLKRTSQKVLDVYLEDFFKVHTFNDHKNAVYIYLKAIDWKNKISSYNIIINTPDYYLSYYNEDLEHYLNHLYEKAQISLDKEDFYSAKATLSEIINLNPNFKDAKSLKDFAHLEPRPSDWIRYLVDFPESSLKISVTPVWPKISITSEELNLGQECAQSILLNESLFYFQDKGFEIVDNTNADYQISIKSNTYKGMTNKRMHSALLQYEFIVKDATGNIVFHEQKRELKGVQSNFPSAGINAYERSIDGFKWDILRPFIKQLIGE